MSITGSEWTKLIKESAEHVADRAYQERSWFGQGPEVSSPDEMFCRMFDDLDLEEYLKSGQVSLTPAQKGKGEQLRDAMNRYAARTGVSLDPSEVINDPAWEKIRKAAADFANTLESG